MGLRAVVALLPLRLESAAPPLPVTFVSTALGAPGQIIRGQKMSHKKTVNGVVYAAPD